MSSSHRRSFDKILILDDFESACRKLLPRAVFEYVRGGAGYERTLRANRTQFDAYRWSPHRLRDVSNIQTQTTFFGETYASPFGLAPTGGAAMVRFKADIHAARAAHVAQTPYILSANSIPRLEDVFRVNPRAWFAAYFPSDWSVIEGMLSRLARAQCRVLVVTADVPVGALRLSETRAGYTMPLRPNVRTTLDALRHPRWTFGTFLPTLLAYRPPCISNIREDEGPNLFSKKIDVVGGTADFTWDHMRRIRDRWPGKLVIKGLLTLSDAIQAAQLGADGIILSNHGGRVLDDAIAPLSILPQIRARLPKTLLLIDSGFRTGSDILKAMALGADGVLFGRPMLQACAFGGEAGVRHAIDLLKEDLRRTMAMIGVEALDDLGSCLLPAPRA